MAAIFEVTGFGRVEVMLGQKFRATAITLFAALRHCIRIWRPLTALCSLHTSSSTNVHGMTCVGPVVAKDRGTQPPTGSVHTLYATSEELGGIGISKDVSMTDGATA
jgi:hypothetical protein